MANEIWHSADETWTLYALIWRQTDDKVYDAVAAANTFDTYMDADILDYDVPLTNQADSDYHSVDFPGDITAGVYRVQVMLQVGGAIDADLDYPIGQGEVYWDGTAELNVITLEAYILSDVIGADGDTLETLSDQTDALAVQGSQVLNVYGHGE